MQIIEHPPDASAFSADVVTAICRGTHARMEDRDSGKPFRILNKRTGAKDYRL